jgi:hypothetical protein
MWVTSLGNNRGNTLSGSNWNICRRKHLELRL